MFPRTYFPGAYFAPRYFPQSEGTPVNLVDGPFYVSASQVFRPGPQVAQRLRPGATEQQVFRPGAAAQQFGLPR